MGNRRFLVFVVVALVLLMTPMCAHAAWVKVCIDHGHGGSDPGAVALGDYEKTFNLDIGLRARTVFQSDAITVVMTRTTDVAVSLQGRCDIANNNGVNRFISTHCNAGGGTGTETYAYASGTESAHLAGHVQSEMVAHMATTNRGVKYSGFYVLLHTNMSAVLGEVAFLDTTADNNKLSSTTYRQLAARAYLHGLQASYGQTPHL